MRKFINFGKRNKGSYQIQGSDSAYGPFAGIASNRRRLSWSLVFVGISGSLFGLHTWQNHLNTARANQIDVNTSSSQPSLNNDNSTIPNQSGASSPDVTGDGTNSSVESSQSINNSSTSSTLTIDGEDVDIPDNGSVHKTIKSNDGKTNIDVHIDNGSGNGSSRQNINTFSSQGHSSTTLNIHSSTKSTSTSK